MLGYLPEGHESGVDAMVEDGTCQTKPSQPATSWRFIAGVLLVSALARLLFVGLGWQNSPAPVEPLAAKLPPTRMTEGWLSGQEYAPYPTLPDKRHYAAIRLGQASMSLHD